MPEEIHDAYDSILILDFGSQVGSSSFRWETRADELIVLSLDHEEMS